MKQFNPPIAERSTTELIVIALDERGEWHPDARDQAEEELKRRRVPYTHKRTVSAQYNERREKQEALLVEQKKNESFSLFEILYLLHSIPLFPLTYLKYRSYKAEGYERKAEVMLVLSKVFAGITLVLIVLALLN